MINKDVFIYKCIAKGLDKTAAEKMYKRALSEKQKKSLDRNLTGMQKKAFDLGYSDALKVLGIIAKSEE